MKKLIIIILSLLSCKNKDNEPICPEFMLIVENDSLREELRSKDELLQQCETAYYRELKINDSLEMR